MIEVFVISSAIEVLLSQVVQAGFQWGSCETEGAGMSVWILVLNKICLQIPSNVTIVRL